MGGANGATDGALSAGAVSIEGPVAAGGRPVARAAQLLEALLPGFDAPPEFRAPGALRLVIARALGTVDLPAFPTLDAFADAPHLADPRRIDVDALGAEVLAEPSGRKFTIQLTLPEPSVLLCVGVERLVEAAVVLAVDLNIAADAEGTDLRAARHARTFERRQSHELPAIRSNHCSATQQRLADAPLGGVDELAETEIVGRGSAVGLGADDDVAFFNA